MKNTAQLTPKFSTRSFQEIWSNRYKLDALPLISTYSGEDLRIAIGEESRKKTALKAQKSIGVSSEFAALKTNGLFSYVPNIVNLKEARQIAGFVEKIYSKLLDVYQQQQISPEWLALINTLNHSNNVLDTLAQVNSISLLAIEQIAREVEPLILELQEQHRSCQDRRTIGFMSTQFHFSTQVLLKQLQPIEQVLLKPYLQFVEEQVCIPWQRVCAAANRHPSGSPVLEVAKSMLLQSQEIEDVTYRQMLSRFPSHRSRRGLLHRPEVAASSIRDINMFQAYLWLCVLEDSMSSVENELLPLCIMVFPSISVDWELAEVGIASLLANMRDRLDAQYILRVRPYMDAMQTLFVNAKNTPLFSEMSQMK